jgi:hypothetical protein
MAKAGMLDNPFCKNNHTFSVFDSRHDDRMSRPLQLVIALSQGLPEGNAIRN